AAGKSEEGAGYQRGGGRARSRQSRAVSRLRGELCWLAGEKTEEVQGGGGRW
ncbi:unnamed protein product, partial [Effrenium voratum]